MRGTRCAGQEGGRVGRRQGRKGGRGKGKRKEGKGGKERGKRKEKKEKGERKGEKGKEALDILGFGALQERSTRYSEILKIEGGESKRGKTLWPPKAAEKKSTMRHIT